MLNRSTEDYIKAIYAIGVHGGRATTSALASHLGLADASVTDMLKKLADAAGPTVHLRVIDREASPELQDELRILGALRVPVVVFLTEDFWEVGRFGDRHLTVYRAKASREIGRGQPQGVLSLKALVTEMAQWVDVFERMLTMVRLSPPLRKRHGD